MSNRFSMNEMLIFQDHTFEKSESNKELIETVKSLERFRMFLYKMVSERIEFLKCLPETYNNGLELEKNFNELCKSQSVCEFDGKRIKLSINGYLPSIYIKMPNEAVKYFISIIKGNVCRSLISTMDKYKITRYEKVFIWIKDYVPVNFADFDNKYFKPFIDSIVDSKLIKDDDADIVKFGGEIIKNSPNPRVEIYIFGDENIPDFLKKI